MMTGPKGELPCFDHERQKLLRETQARLARFEQPEEPSWRKPKDDFTDRTLQRIMDKLDAIERTLARIEDRVRYL